MEKIEREQADRLRAAIGTTGYVSTRQIRSSTYDFYRYPARLPPTVARTAIEEFSKKNDWIVDPFMGGGTSIVEAIQLGRRALGVDINALAHFITDVRTHPMSTGDEDALREWALDVSVRIVESDASSGVELAPDRRAVRNLPPPVETFMAGALQLASEHKLVRRQQRFARAALLRVGQLCLESYDRLQPRRKRLAESLPRVLERMFEGMRNFVDDCAARDISKNAITRRRSLLHRTAVGLAWDPRVEHLRGRAKLVFTSPPYPYVNVLYHRWAHRGRKQTPAPYWIANVPDGYGASFYTGGSQTPTGLRNYFAMITSAFSSVADLVAPGGHVVQLVGFNDIELQLPLYMECMRKAGLEECEVVGAPLDRRVANRRWFAKRLENPDTATEYMLIHRRPTR
jgi:DNA methylase